MAGDYIADFGAESMTSSPQRGSQPPWIQEEVERVGHGGHEQIGGSQGFGRSTFGLYHSNPQCRDAQHAAVVASVADAGDAVRSEPPDIGRLGAVFATALHDLQ